MKTILKIIVGAAILLLTAKPLMADEKLKMIKDTIFTYNSPRPLLEDPKNRKIDENALGLEVLFSGSGVGLGLFYNRNFSDDISGFLSLYITGVRNTDEIEDWYGIVANKVNRLLELPLMIGIQKNVFSDMLFDSFKPYISAGFGPTFIIAGPYEGYEYSFFSSMGHAAVYTRFGGFLGIGANIGAVGATQSGLNLRYYYIPFGGDGLESIKKLPISNFGGVFLTLSVGGTF